MSGNHPAEANDINLNQVMLNDINEYSTNELIKRVGRFGLFQVIGFLFALINFIVDGALIYNLAFLTLMPDYICNSGFSEDAHCSNQEACSIRESGLGYFYVNWQNSTSLHNWIEELDLMCAPQASLGIFGALYFVGVVLSNLFLSRIGDVYGRIPSIKWSMLVTVILFAMLCFLPPSISLYYFIVFVFGLTFSTRATTSFLYSQEIFSGEDSTMVSTFLNLSDSCNMTLMAFYFYYISKEWSYFFYVWFLLLTISFVATFFLPESPAYLIDQGRFSEARQSLNFIAKVNGRPTLHPSLEQMQAQVRSELFANLENLEDEKSFLQLISERINVINIFAISMILGSSSFSYYIISFYVKYFPGSLYRTVVIANLAEVAAVFASGLIATYSGNKFTVILFFFISALFSSLIILLGSAYSLLLLVTIFFTKFGIAGTFNIAFVVIPEYFEPSYRSTVFGIANVFARTFTITSSVVAEMKNPWPMLTVAVFSYLSIASTFALRKKDQYKAKEVF